MRGFFLAFFLVVACATGTEAGPYEDAFSALQREDYALAARLIRPLAEQGDTNAQNNLARMFANGQGVPLDYRKAVQWYRKAAIQGNAEAQEALGVMYVQGRGVQQDAQEAVKWYSRAARRGNAEAQFSLGLMYDSGQGVPQDFIRAHMWYNVAAAALSDDSEKKATEHRDRVASQMTPAQIEKAQEMARRCQQSQSKECD
ncbi:MAG: tetratricopeptide repeat protein [Nitrospirota bacterium]